MSSLTTVIWHTTGSPSPSNQTTKRNRSTQINKEKVKLSLFGDDIVLYTKKKKKRENPKDSTKNLIELIHEFSKVAGYKINVLKYVAFLYKNNGVAEREIKESIPFTIAPKSIRYLEINPTKEVKDLYSENL